MCYLWTVKVLEYYVAGNTGLVGSAIVRTSYIGKVIQIILSQSNLSHWDLRNHDGSVREILFRVQ